MKIKYVTLHTPTEKLSVKIEYNPEVIDESTLYHMYDEILNGRLLDGSLTNSWKFNLNVNENVIAIVPREILKQSFITIGIEK